MDLLHDDVVVLAGATGRVGGETLARFVTEGARVLVPSRSLARANETIVRHLPPNLRARASALEADLACPENGELTAWTALERYGRLDAVVSLVGGGGPFVRVADSQLADLQASLEGHLHAAYTLFVPALRVMLTQAARPGARSRGRLVAVTAGSSREPQPRFGIMGLAKAGVNVLMQAIAREHKSDGIVANAVILGTVATEAARERLAPDALEAAAQPGEVADVLAFLASDRASGLNGALIDLNARETD